MSEYITIEENESVKEFIKRFNEIKKMGWITSHRKNNTGIGKTLEDLLMIEENNSTDADLGDVEIKSQRALASSKITLFTKKPTEPDNANKYLRDNYGEPNLTHPGIMKLHASMFNYWNKVYEKWGMRLQPDDESERIYLQIKNLENEKIEPFICWYDYDVIREIFSKKMNIIAYVSAESKLNNEGNEQFNFTGCKLFYGGSFEKFLLLMNDGKIMYDIRIGSYKTPGKNYGKLHDHGSGFRISKSHMIDLFEGFIEL